MEAFSVSVSLCPNRVSINLWPPRASSPAAFATVREGHCGGRTLLSTEATRAVQSLKLPKSTLRLNHALGTILARLLKSDLLNAFPELKRWNEGDLASRHRLFHAQGAPLLEFVVLGLYILCFSCWFLNPLVVTLACGMNNMPVKIGIGNLEGHFWCLCELHYLIVADALTGMSRASDLAIERCSEV